MAKEKRHRGRFQAQGNGTEKSVPWTLTQAELSARQDCFKKASLFIQRAPSYGISAFFKHSCIPFPPVKDIRVDIDVLAGVAFIDDKV